MQVLPSSTEQGMSNYLLICGNEVWLGTDSVVLLPFTILQSDHRNMNTLMCGPHLI